MDGVLSAHDREGLHRKSALLGPLWPPCKLRAGVVGLADGRQVRIGERGRMGEGGDSRAVSIPSIMVFTCASSPGYNTESSKGKPRVYSGNRTFPDNLPSPVLRATRTTILRIIISARTMWKLSDESSVLPARNYLMGRPRSCFNFVVISRR